MIAEVDKDGTGVIQYSDFADLMSAKIAERDPRE